MNKRKTIIDEMHESKKFLITSATGTTILGGCTSYLHYELARGNILELFSTFAVSSIAVSSLITFVSLGLTFYGINNYINNKNKLHVDDNIVKKLVK